MSFQADRRTGIGGSDAAAVLGISPWRTRYDLYLEKIGEASPLPLTEPMRWGTLLEPVIAAEYSRRTGALIQPSPALLRHPKYDWMIGHIDAWIGSSRILEIKATALPVGWGEPGSDQIPLQYSAQVHHYLTLTDTRSADVAVLIGGRDFRIYTIQRDDDIAGTLLEAEDAFWQHVVEREPPDPSNVADAVRRWGRLHSPGRVTATAEDAAVINRLREIKTASADLQAAEDEARRVIMAALGERGDTLVDLAGNELATWRLSREGKSFDVKSFAQDQPALYEQYCIAKPGTRRFLLKD